AVLGPIVLLFGLGVAILMSLIFGRQMGDVACAWRVSYSPSRNAFSIWGLIFAWLMASVVEQLLVPLNFDGVYAASAWNNMLAGTGLAAAGCWVVVFGCSRREDRKAGLVVSALFLLSSTWCAVGASVLEYSWRGFDPLRILFVGVPFSLFAGWMCVASALGIGIAVVSMRYEPDYRCIDADRTYDMFTCPQLAPTLAAGLGGWVPLLLSLPMTVTAVVLPDPILPLPLLWGIYYMRGHRKNRIAMCLLSGACAAAVMFAYLDVWIA
ncbi:MAG: hypothetical protein ACKVI4_14235, partial [Actinomycetales bacterium]